MSVRRALVVGGTGLVGRAAARRLLASGWDVDVTGRDPARLRSDVAAAGGRFRPVDRQDGGQLRAAVGDGVDLLVDCICYTAADARLLVPLLDDVGSAVMISSKAVYVDDLGRHSNSDVSPSFGGPVNETQPTLAPGYGDYQTRDGYGANKVAAERVLLDSGHPVTVLRPSKIHGEGASPPREWIFVKRVLDRRPAVFLAHRGEGIDHPTAAANIAALIETVADKPGTRILNSADPDAPNGLEIARTIARRLDHEWDEILLDGAEVGRHPWDKLPPFVLDMATSAVAQGKLRVAHNKRVKIPHGWLIDDQGNPADDPRWGVIAPLGAMSCFGEHKGYGLAVACELLGGALTGGGVTDYDNKTQRRVLNGMISIVIDAARLGTEQAFKKDAKSFLAWLRASRPAPGHDRVRIAGEPERETRAKREREGIPVDDETWREIRAASGKLGIASERIDLLARGTERPAPPTAR